MTSRFYLLSVMVALCVVLSQSAWSYPTIFGDSGLVLIPTTDVQPYLTFDTALNYTRITDPAGESGTNIAPIRLNYGVAQNAEVFALISLSGLESDVQAVGAGAKVRLLEEDKTRWLPGVAIGGRVTSFEEDIDRDIVNAYAVASMPIYVFSNSEGDNGYQIRAHAGIDYTKYSGDVDDDFFSGFGGISYEAGNGTSFVLEYLPEQESNGVTVRSSTLSGALRLPLSTHLAMELGATRPFGVGESQVYAGINVRFGDPIDVPRDNPYQTNSYDMR